jgi:hypothetical protein
MTNQSNTLRRLIRAILHENYNVSIVGSPISTGEKKKRGEKPETDVMANVVLSREDFNEFIGIAQSKDMLQVLGSEEDQTIKLRVDEIRNRVGSAAANLARALIMSLEKGGPGSFDGILFNLPGPDGTVEATEPSAVTTYNIPPLLRQLALFDKKGLRGAAIGKGEALAILMFGRAENAGPEPDLIVSEDLQFSVKFFEDSSRTVYVGAGVESSDAENEVVELTEFLRDLSMKKKQGRGETNITLYQGGKNVSRNQMRKILGVLAQDIRDNYPNKSDIYFSSEEKRADYDPTGIAGEEFNLAPTAGEILQKIRRCAQLWDTSEIKLSNHDVLALLGGANMSFIVVPKQDLRIGSIDFSRKIPELTIASPSQAKIIVSPGA